MTKEENNQAFLFKLLNYMNKSRGYKIGATALSVLLLVVLFSSTCRLQPVLCIAMTPALPVEFHITGHGQSKALSYILLSHFLFFRPLQMTTNRRSDMRGKEKREIQKAKRQHACGTSIRSDPFPLVIFLPVESETKQQHKLISGGFSSHVLLCLQPGLRLSLPCFHLFDQKKNNNKMGKRQTFPYVGHG